MEGERDRDTMGVGLGRSNLRGGGGVEKAEESLRSATTLLMVPSAASFPSPVIPYAQQGKIEGPTLRAPTLLSLQSYTDSVPITRMTSLQRVIRAGHQLWMIPAKLNLFPLWVFRCSTN